MCDGIYQVRGYDMANLTVIEGDTGWIIFDPLMSIECSHAAMQLIEQNLGSRSVKVVIISHPHVDHFGGVLGVMSEDEQADSEKSLAGQPDSGKIPIIVPESFAEHAIPENVYAGKAMGRRANYQYGVLLEPGVTGILAQREVHRFVTGQHGQTISPKPLPVTEMRQRLHSSLTTDEISNMIELPEALEKVWYTRQYYGTVAHDSKAVYQKNMGWYDAYPVSLNLLTPTDSAKKAALELRNGNRAAAAKVAKNTGAMVR